MRPIITVTAVVILHLCVVAMLVAVNGCRSTSGFEKPADTVAFSGIPRKTSVSVPAAPSVEPPRIISSPSPSANTLVPVPVPVPSHHAQPQAPSSGKKRTIVKGESLTSIALSEKVSRADLAKANGISLNALLKEGQVLVIPETSTPRTAKPPTKAATKTHAKVLVKPGSTSPTKNTPSAVPVEPTPTFAPLILVPVSGNKPSSSTAPAPAPAPEATR